MASEKAFIMRLYGKEGRALWKQLKAAAALQRTSINQFVVETIAARIAELSKKQGG